MRRVTVRLPDQVHAELQECRRRVRAEGHKPPTISTLIGALIHEAVDTEWGDTFEDSVLVPYRKAFKEAA